MLTDDPNSAKNRMLTAMNERVRGLAHETRLPLSAG